MGSSYPTTQQTFADESAVTVGTFAKQNDLYETVELLQDRVGYTGDLASDAGSQTSQIKNLQNIGAHSVTTVAVASAFTMPATHNVVVTGTSPAITSMTASGNDLGRVVYMRFTDAATVTSGSNVLLDSASFVGPGTLILGCDGTNWFEHGRSGDTGLTFGTSATAVATASASGAAGTPSDSGHVHNLPNGLITFAMINSGAVGTASGQLAEGDHTHAAEGHEIQEDGTPLADQPALNFGTGLIATNNTGNSRTDVNADIGSGATQVAAGNHTHGGGAGDATSLQGVAIDASLDVTDGHVLTYVSSGSQLELKAPTGGSGGNGLARLGVFTAPPLASTFTAINSGAGVIVEDIVEGIHMVAPGAGTANLRCFVKTPTNPTPYTLTACVIMTGLGLDFSSAGILWRESSSGKIITLQAEFQSNATRLNLHKYDSPTAFSANYTGSFWGDGYAWLKIEDDGVNRIVYISRDGRYFTQMHTIGRTDFLTADQIGFFANSQNNGDVHNVVLSWVEA